MTDSKSNCQSSVESNQDITLIWVYYGSLTGYVIGLVLVLQHPAENCSINCGICLLHGFQNHISTAEKRKETFKGN